MTMMTWSPGHIIAERYRLIRPIDRGGMGEVWQAEHVTLRAPVAVKLLDPNLLDRHSAQDDVVARFLLEAQAAAALRSPHVVQILDHGVHQGIPYMTMELLEGETLAERLARGALPFETTARIMTHVARAVGKAHEVGIIHRDLKPANIFLVRNDDEELAKVLDFGIAKLMRSPLDPQEGAPMTRSGFLIGTPSYMSPEQLQGRKDVDWRADLWAMGVIAFECVCGQRPFGTEAVGRLVLEICAKPLPIPSQIAPVPPGFDAWWRKAASQEPAGRFQSARELSEMLRAVLAPDALSLSGPFRAPTGYGIETASIHRPSSVPPPGFAPTAPPAGPTARAMVSAVHPPTGGRRLGNRGFFGAMAVGAVVGGAVLFALWRAVPPVPKAGPESGTAAQAAGDVTNPTAEPTVEPAPTVAPVASAEPLISPEPVVSASAAPSASAPLVTPAPRPATGWPRPTGTGKRKDRLGF